MDDTLCSAPTVQAGTDGFCTRPIGHSGSCVTVRTPRTPHDPPTPTGDEVRRVLAWLTSKGVRPYRFRKGRTLGVNDEGLAAWADAERGP